MKLFLISILSFLSFITCSQQKSEVQTSKNNSPHSTVVSHQDSTGKIETPENKNSTKTENNSLAEYPTEEIKTGSIPKNTTTNPTSASSKSTIVKPAKGRLSQPEMIYFKEKENKFLKDFEMNVTFNKITEDSRCPKNVKCVWEGVAVAEITLMGTYTRPMTINLSTLNNAAKGYQSSTEFNGYKITLESVTPYPSSSSKKTDGKYEIGITIRPTIDKDDLRKY